MMNAPKRIWVDTCKDADGEPEWDTGAWSLNQEQDDDKEYVRADLFAKAVEALQAAKIYIADLQSHEGAEGFSSSTNQAADTYFAALAELEGK